MPCPKCGVMMRTHNRSGVAIEQCDGCGGMFLDYGEIEALRQREGQIPMVQATMAQGGQAPNTPGAVLHCPKCGSPMRSVMRSGITIEQCDRCRGVFLDHGEIEALKQREGPMVNPGWAAQPRPQPYGYHHPPQYHHYHHGYHPGYYRRPKTGWELLFTT